MISLRRCIPTGAAFVTILIAVVPSGAQEIAIAPQFEQAGNFHHGVAPVLQDRRWGLIDRTGKWVVQPRYSSMLRGGDGLFPVSEGSRWGFISANGTSVIDQKFEAVEPFENGTAAVKAHGRWGYLRPDSTVDVDFNFLELGGRAGALISGRDADGWGIFEVSSNSSPKRLQGGELSDAERVYGLSEKTGIARYKDRETFFMLLPDVYGPGGGGHDFVYTLPGEYVSIRPMSEGFAPAAVAGNTWGYLHKASANFLWPGRFQDALNFSQGLAPVKIQGKWGYIDRAGRVIVEPAYDAAFPFRGQYAVMREGEKRGFLRVDPQAGVSVFIPGRYEDAFRFTEGLAPVKIGGKWGYISDGQARRPLVDVGLSDIRPR
jgi:hypothetical protein